MPLPVFCLRMALLYAVAAMLMALHMAAAADYALMASHAHLAVIGWFGLISTGFVYRNFPKLAIRGGWQVAGGLALGVPALSLGLGLDAYGAAGGSALILAGGGLMLVSVAWLAFAAWTTEFWT